jgi:hypothetical protein
MQVALCHHRHKQQIPHLSAAMDDTVPSLASDLALLAVCSIGGLVIRGEGETDAVDAVSLVSGCVEALALEDVAQVAATVRAHNLRPRHAKGAVLVACDGTWDAVKVGGPSAAGAELVVRLVERSLAAGTGVDTLGGIVLVVGTRTGSLGSLLAKNTELL